MRVLNLTLKKRWFDMIASGEKKEEYREDKEYWRRRLTNWPAGFFDYGYYQFDQVRFTNGYGSDRPTMLVECKGLSMGLPAFKWYGAPAEKPVFIISLGDIIEKSNF